MIRIGGEWDSHCLSLPWALLWGIANGIIASPNHKCENRAVPHTMNGTDEDVRNLRWEIVIKACDVWDPTLLRNKKFCFFIMVPVGFQLYH